MLRTILRLVGFAGTAVIVAWIFRAFYSGPMLPRTMYGVGSIAWLAAAAAARISRRKDRPHGDETVNLRRPRLDLVLSWIALLWAALALL